MQHSDQHSEYWFGIARDDLRSAEILVRENGPLDTAAFHYHQALEKMLKGLLIQAGTAIPRIHDLERLFLLLPASIQEKAHSVYESVSFIHSFYSSFRYPQGDRLCKNDLDIIAATFSRVLEILGNPLAIC